MRERGRTLPKASSEGILSTQVRTVDTSWSLRELNKSFKQGIELIHILRKEAFLAAERRIYQTKQGDHSRQETMRYVGVEIEKGANLRSNGNVGLPSLTKCSPRELA